MDGSRDGPAGRIHAGRAVIVVWVVTGPLFGFSDTWQLVINTGTTIITFLMVFLIQSTQNRDAEAVQVKLDEIIRAIGNAKNELLDLQELEEKDLDEIRATYTEMAQIGPRGRSKEQAATRDGNVRKSGRGVSLALRTSCPEQIRRYAGRMMTRPGQVVAGRYVNSTTRSRPPENVKRRHDRIAEGAIRPVDVGPRLAQAEQPGDRQDVEDQGGRDDVVEQIAVEVPVASLVVVLNVRGRTSTAAQIPCSNSPHAGTLRPFSVPAGSKNTPSRAIA